MAADRTNCPCNKTPLKRGEDLRGAEGQRVGNVGEYLAKYVLFPLTPSHPDSQTQTGSHEQKSSWLRHYGGVVLRGGFIMAGAGVSRAAIQRTTVVMVTPVVRIPPTVAGSAGHADTVGFRQGEGHGQDEDYQGYQPTEGLPLSLSHFVTHIFTNLNSLPYF